MLCLNETRLNPWLMAAGEICIQFTLDNHKKVGVGLNFGTKTFQDY